MWCAPDAGQAPGVRMTDTGTWMRTDVIWQHPNGMQGQERAVLTKFPYLISADSAGAAAGDVVNVSVRKPVKHADEGHHALHFFLMIFSPMYRISVYDICVTQCKNAGFDLRGPTPCAMIKEKIMKTHLCDIMQVHFYGKGLF